MKRLIGILLIIALFIGGYFLFKKETVIFYSPHADDEVLSMGGSIIKAVEEDKNVIVILLSKGLASSAYHKVNTKLQEEGYDNISPDEFGKARIKEFKKSVETMGVKPENIHIYDLPDAEFTPDMVKEVMIDMEKDYPGATHHVMTYHDPHPDHASTGKALKALQKEGTIKKAGYYHIPIQEFDNLSFTGKDEISEDNAKKYKKALNAYGEWAPEKGKFQIGQISVTDYFDNAIKYLESRWHQ